MFSKVCSAYFVVDVVRSFDLMSDKDGEGDIVKFGFIRGLLEGLDVA